MRLGLGARLAFAFATLAALTALVTAGVSAYSTNRSVNADVDGFLQVRSLDVAEGRRSATGLASSGQSRPPRNQSEEDGDGKGNGNRGDDDDGATQGNEQIRNLVDSDAVVQVFDVNGVIVGRVGFELPLGAADKTLLDTRDTPVIRTIDVDGEQYRMITRHIEGGGIVQVAQSLSTTNVLLGEVRSELLLVGVIMSTLAAVVGWGIAQRTTRPLRRLTTTVEAVAATQDLSTPVVIDRSDEIGRLSEEFDGLLKILATSRDQQQRLVQDAAHELRTPLTSVRANIDFLERAPDLDEADRQLMLTSIKSELAELSSVLAEVVDLATESRGAANFEEIDLAVVAEAAIAQFELRSARPVVRMLQPSLVAGDRSALVRATQNLIGNADKYSPADSPIKVTVAGGSLFVSDEGPGIAPEERHRVFDRFYRSDRDRSAPGSGLGLAIVAKAAAEHGGSAWVRDAQRGGAEVGFTLPAFVTHPSHYAKRSTGPVKDPTQP